MTVAVENVADYELDLNTGSSTPVYLAIKGFNQQAIVRKIVERKGLKSLGLTAVDDTTKRRYSTGCILFTDLARESVGDDLLATGQAIEAVEPYHVATQGELLAWTAGNRFEFVGPGGRRTITNPWMAYLHSLDFSPDGERLLLVSTGFDTIQEVDLATGDVVFEWNAWDHGFTWSEPSQTHYVRNRDQGERLRAEHPGVEVVVVADPADWPPEGLATQQTPLNLNGVFHGPGTSVLATGYHRPELFVIERDGSHRLHDLGLLHPHSFQPVNRPPGYEHPDLGIDPVAADRVFHQGYMVSNTGAGQYILLDTDFQPATVVDFSGLPADTDKKAGFGEWLQTVSFLDEADGVIVAVDALRDGIHVVDLVNRRRRFVANRPNWTIQTASAIAATHASTMIEQSAAFAAD